MRINTQGRFALQRKIRGDRMRAKCSKAAKLDRFWLEYSAPIPRLGGAQNDEDFEVLGCPEGIHSEARC
jgi:hypothetical protein